MAANGDILMLEAAPEASRPWSASSNAETIDALPYIDEDYGNPAIKIEVDRLVEDEMRRSSKKPSDFLKDLPPIPTFNFEVRVLNFLLGVIYLFLFFNYCQGFEQCSSFCFVCLVDLIGLSDVW